MNNDFSPDGILAQTIHGFTPREAQKTMSNAIKQAIDEKAQLIVEAGTGTGKTFAYLVPALRSNKKVIISTGSKSLQDQLYSKDLPIIKQALMYSEKISLLKGRSNYLCLERLENYSTYSKDIQKATLEDIKKLQIWGLKTLDGDINACENINEDSAAWPLVTSTNDNCLGADCLRYNDCFVVKARRKALSSQVIVVNHHLFFADLAVKESGFAELMPQADIFIFDEAHQLPDIASQHFGQQLTSRQLIGLAKDLSLIYYTELRDLNQLQKCADKLTYATQDFRLALGESQRKGDLAEKLADLNIHKAKTNLAEALIFCQEVVELSVKRSITLETCLKRLEHATTLLEKLSDTETIGYSYWYECSQLHFTLALTPLSVADQFKTLIEEKKASWIFTSATLAVNGHFSYFSHRLGLERAKSLLLDSPFDYPTQALLCVPRYLPEPSSPNMASMLVNMLTPIIEKNRGRCFFLCTSYQMMRNLAEGFRQSIDLPVLMQGENSKSKLLEEFIQQGNAILIATQSFWEGIDVQGDTLSCVIIDKLPFSAPDDPLLKARMDSCKKSGNDPFKEIQLPEAIITLKQGVGRLIRHNSDRGVVIICDHRLVLRSYGQIILKSLPAFSRTRCLTKTQTFLQQSLE